MAQPMAEGQDQARRPEIAENGMVGDQRRNESPMTEADHVKSVLSTPRATPLPAS